MGRSKTNGQLIETAERRNFVLRLRKSGATLREIANQAQQYFGADQLPQGWDSLYVAKDIKRELERVKAERDESVDEIIALEIERLDRLFMAMWQRALQGDEKAIDRCLRIMQRRADLLGLDAPKRQELAGPGGGPVPIAIVNMDIDEL